MAIFKLQNDDGKFESAVLVPAQKSSLELEQHLEHWLENSPSAIALEPLLIIGRQTSAVQEDARTIFPDLLGIDREGRLVIIELKKGKTPRDVVAQILEYAAWANDLSEDRIHEIAAHYLKSSGRDLVSLYKETFDTEEFPELNTRLRLFIAAEEISVSVATVCRFLRQEHGMDVTCVQFNVHQTDAGEILVHSEAIVGLEDVVAPKRTAAKTARWSGDKPVKLVVWEAVQGFVGDDVAKVFSPKDICARVLLM